MPFSEAAEMGTHKVITEHSTIGMLITTDGSIGDIGRDAYIEAEERIVKELKALGKPFAMILNSAHPEGEAARTLAYELEEKYGVPVALVSCLDLDAEDIRHILGLVLEEFPVTEISIQCPEWMRALDAHHRIRTAIRASVCHCAENIKRAGDVKSAFDAMAENEYIERANIDLLDLGTGKATISLCMKEGLYYDIISELTGFSVRGEEELITLLRDLSVMKEKYDKVAMALDAVNERGYGIVMPDVEDCTSRNRKLSSRQAATVSNCVPRHSRCI